MDTVTRILRRPEVSKLTGLSIPALKVLERRGAFPKRRRLSPETGGRSVGWISTEVEAWIRDRPLGVDVRADVGGDLPSRRKKTKKKIHKRKRSS